MSMIQKPNIIIATTGSVATIKISELVESLLPFCNIAIVASSTSFHFFKEDSIPSEVNIYKDEDEYLSWKQIGDPVLHIELRKWADLMVIAPLSANTLAKIANGLCDNLITCIVRAWDMNKPLLVAPAMNTLMFEHPFTSKHLAILKDELNIQVIDPISKKLACKDVGMGAMASVSTIVSKVKAILCIEENLKLNESNDA